MTDKQESRHGHYPSEMITIPRELGLKIINLFGSELTSLENSILRNGELPYAIDKFDPVKMNAFVEGMLSVNKTITYTEAFRSCMVFSKGKSSPREVTCLLEQYGILDPKVHDVQK